MNQRQWIGWATVLLLVTAVGCQVEPTEAPSDTPAGAEYEGDAFTFNQITDDIYHVRGTGNLSAWCNAAVVINDDDVLVVDTFISEAAAWALLQELKRITDKPVRYVVNTHYHFDHSHGNGAFSEDVNILGHVYTREMMAAGRSKVGRAYEAYIVDRLPALQEQMNGWRDEMNSTSDSDRRSELEKQISVQENFMAAIDAVEPVPPDIAFTKQMTLHLGGREIRLLHFGRAHTEGDIVVHLPEEKILVTGDLLPAALPYMGDGYLEDWADVLEQLKELDFDVILPGDGRVYRDKERIDHLQAFFRDLWEKAAKMLDQGLSAEEAAPRIDMRSHAAHYPNITGMGASLLAVQRVYELLEEEAVNRSR